MRSRNPNDTLTRDSLMAQPLNIGYFQALLVCQNLR